MTGLSVSPMERGVIRVFALDLPARDLARLSVHTVLGEHFV